MSHLRSRLGALGKALGPKNLEKHMFYVVLCKSRWSVFGALDFHFTPFLTPFWPQNGRGKISCWLPVAEESHEINQDGPR